MKKKIFNDLLQINPLYIRRKLSIPAGTGRGIPDGHS